MAYQFHDLELEMASQATNRVPILRHGDFTLCKTSAMNNSTGDVVLPN